MKSAATGVQTCAAVRAGALADAVAVVILSTAQHASVPPPPIVRFTRAVVGSTS